MLNISNGLCQSFVIHTTPFYNCKIPTTNKSVSLVKKITLVQVQGQLAQRSQVSRALTHWSNNKNHEIPLQSNKPKPFKAPEACFEPFKTPFPALLAPEIAWYT